jgi:hypothetical protein
VGRCHDVRLLVGVLGGSVAGVSVGDWIVIALYLAIAVGMILGRREE